MTINTHGKNLAGESRLTVIIPVFNAYDCVAECLDSLDRATPEVPVLIIDDASDDPRIRPLLKSWAEQGKHRWVHFAERNRGFVGTANWGAEQVNGDFILLNSDTLVTSGWYQALKACLASDRLIATATPWSNNAEIVSLPDFCVANPVPQDPEAWATAVQQTQRGRYPELPTGVGFCMAVSRAAVNGYGLFDEAAFGKGYGEENDFCRRVAAGGWRNVLCENAFVVHKGGASFGPLGLKPGEESMSNLLAKHPDYLDLVTKWIREDPLSAQREEAVKAFQSVNMASP